MPYEICGLLNNQIIFTKAMGHYSLSDIQNVVIETVKLADTSPDKCIILNDLTKIKSIHRNLLEAREATRPIFTHPKHTLTTVYGTSERVIVNFLVNSLAGLFKQPVRAFPSQTDAVNFITQQYPELAKSLPQALIDLDKLKPK